MDYNNDNRTPLDRVDEGFLAEMFDGSAVGESLGGKRSVFSEAVTGTCTAREDFELPTLDGAPLAMVYSPKQEWECIYEAEEGFVRGTIFKHLDLPFKASDCAGCRTTASGAGRRVR